MRRIVTAVRSLIDRALPNPLDILALGSWLGVAYFISLYDGRLAIGWLTVVPFVVAALLEVAAYRRQRSR